MRYTQRVSVWPVGLVGYLMYESPIVKSNRVQVHITNKDTIIKFTYSYSMFYKVYYQMLPYTYVKKYVKQLLTQ